MMAWLLLFFYVFFWAKTSFGFIFNTFGAIVRDTKINSDNPIEESYNLGWMSFLMLFGSAYTYWLNKNDHMHIQLFSLAYLVGSVLHFGHYKLLRNFHTEPTMEELGVYV